MFLVGFFSSIQCGRAVKKNHKVQKKKHTIWTSYPRPWQSYWIGTKRTHSKSTGHTKHSHSGGGGGGGGWIMIIHTLQRTSLTPSMSHFCVWIRPPCLCFRLSLLAKKKKKKSMRGWSHCNVCVFAFLRKEENQRRRITRNINKTHPGLT